MGERKGQGLYNRLSRRVKANNPTDNDRKVCQLLYNLSDNEFNIIMDNVMKDNRTLTTSRSSS